MNDDAVVSHELNLKIIEQEIEISELEKEIQQEYKLQKEIDANIDKKIMNIKNIEIQVMEQDSENERINKDLFKITEEENILLRENEILVKKLELRKKARILKKENILKLKERMILQKKPTIVLVLDSCKIKGEIFIKSFLLSISIYFVVCLCMERNFGLIPIISKSFYLNNFFITIASGRFLFHIGHFFGVAKSIMGEAQNLFFPFSTFCWVITCILTTIMFPKLSGIFVQDGSANVEIYPSAYDKTCIFLLLFFVNFISQTASTSFWLYCVSKCKPIWLPPDLQENAKRNLISIIQRTSVIEGVLALFMFFLIFVIIGIGSLSNIANLNQDMDIFLFGYCFPFIKAAVVTVSYGVCTYFSELQHWSAEYTSKMTSAFAMAAVTVCTLSQLFIVFRNANDYPLFLYQYLPHEVIKKLSWLTFHPLYLKIKMRIIDILSASFNNALKKIDKVNPAEVKNKYKRRLTEVVFANLGATAGEIVGRQFGEELCMILICIWMLPISQEFLFNQIYPSSSSLPFPSYESIGVMIIGAAYGTETILTILCFVILQRVGIPLMTNRQVLEIHRMSWGMFIFTSSGFMLVLAATFIY